MSQDDQYQPARGENLSDAQEVLYSKDFKQADTTSGVRKEKVEKAKKQNPKLKK